MTRCNTSPIWLLPVLAVLVNAILANHLTNRFNHMELGRQHATALDQTNQPTHFKLVDAKDLHMFTPAGTVATFPETAHLTTHFEFEAFAHQVLNLGHCIELLQKAHDKPGGEGLLHMGWGILKYMMDSSFELIVYQQETIRLLYETAHLLQMDGAFLEKHLKPVYREAIQPDLNKLWQKQKEYRYNKGLRKRRDHSAGRQKRQVIAGGLIALASGAASLGLSGIFSHTAEQRSIQREAQALSIISHQQEDVQHAINKLRISSSGAHATAHAIEVVTECRAEIQEARYHVDKWTYAIDKLLEHKTSILFYKEDKMTTELQALHTQLAKKHLTTDIATVHDLMKCPTSYAVDHYTLTIAIHVPAYRSQAMAYKHINLPTKSTAADKMTAMTRLCTLCSMILYVYASMLHPVCLWLISYYNAKYRLLGECSPQSSEILVSIHIVNSVAQHAIS